MASWRKNRVLQRGFRHVFDSLHTYSVLFATGLLLLTNCSDTYTPKPRGYFRIDLPVREYRVFDSAFPYLFEYPVYGEIIPDSSKLAEPWWVNLYFKRFNATLHLSYKPVSGNLAALLDDAHTMVNKHIPKANAITQREFEDRRNHVYGLEYIIRGSDAASPYQFYVTDSVHHFVRGALYFNMVPNNDSLMPVIDFLQTDLQHLITTLRWRKN
jgi:gliding motility-associated lipoprotein GldD